MIDREKVIKGLECCTEAKKYVCDECPYHHDPDGGMGSNCDQLEKDALEFLKGQEPERPEKIETGKMKICGLVSETKVDGRFNNFVGGFASGMTFSWRDLITDERKELWMTFEEWIRFSKEITEAVARFKMEG